jgi:hypothetical protein
VIDIGRDERRIERKGVSRNGGIEVLNPGATAFQRCLDAAEHLADRISPLGSWEFCGDQGEPRLQGGPLEEDRRRPRAKGRVDLFEKPGDSCLQALVERDPRSETRTQLASRWPARRQVLDDLLQALRGLLRVLPFSHVSRAEITAAGLTGVAADPSYARAWGRGWRALRHGLESDRTAERLWISPSWEIYERWCFLRLGRALAAAMPAWNWRAHSGGRRWTAAFDGTTAELLLQPVFSAYDSGRARRSISGERQPDIVLMVSGPDGARFVVLDAKYRTSRQGVLDAMASAHLYRDALRIGDARPLASLLLVPAGGGAPWLEDADFHAQQRVGVCVLSPGQPSSLPAAVRAAVE